jgi:hypothetical protein
MVCWDVNTVEMRSRCVFLQCSCEIDDDGNIMKSTRLNSLRNKIHKHVTSAAHLAACEIRKNKQEWLLEKQLGRDVHEAFGVETEARPRPWSPRPRQRPRLSCSRPRRDRDVGNFNRGETETEALEARDRDEAEAFKARDDTEARRSSLMLLQRPNCPED